MFVCDTLKLLHRSANLMKFLSDWVLIVINALVPAVPGAASHREQSPVIQMSNTLINKGAESELACNLLTSRKRAREDEDLNLVNTRQQQLLNIEYQQSHPVLISQGTGVSTCLNLAFEEDDRLNSTSCASTSCRDVSPSLLAAMGEDLNRQLQQQREEVEQFFKLQVCFKSAPSH